MRPGANRREDACRIPWSARPSSKRFNEARRKPPGRPDRTCELGVDVDALQ